MSNHKDYTKYSKEYQAETEEALEAVLAATVAEVESEPEVQPAPINSVVETIEEPTAESEPTPKKIGRVFGCAKLNVRKFPKSKAEIVCEISCHTEVEIDEDRSTEDFYKIYTASGVEGYCMKTYILEK